MNNKKNNTMAKNGFTVVEMIVAISILAMILALVNGIGTAVWKNSRTVETRNIQATVGKAIQACRENTRNSKWPDGDGGKNSTAAVLRELRNEPGSAAILERLPQAAVTENSDGNDILIDGFGRPMLYDSRGDATRTTPLITSRGLDLEDDADDISIPVTTGG